MKKLWFKIVLIAFIEYFILFGEILATSIDSTFRIPSQLGIIREVFDARSTAQNKGQTIIYLQDAHCNYGAQKNMAKILEYLAKEHGLRLIMVEGGSGNVNLSFLRNYGDKEQRESVADKYLMRGEISGEEYLDMVSDYNLDLYGIEDQGLYDAHLAAFDRIDSIRQEGLRYIGELFHIVEELKPYIYSDSLRQLEKKKRNYEEKRISLIEYSRFLLGMALKQGLSLKDCPNLTAFCEIAQLEKAIDFKLAELERNTFIKDLARSLDARKTEELINKSKAFKSGKITSQKYYSFLKTVAETRLDLEHNYPYLDSYIQYIAVSKEINVKDLLTETNSIEEKIKETFFTNSDQRMLSEISKSLDLLKGLLNLELIPEDYEYFQTNRSKFLTTSWIDFLTQNSLKYNLALYLPRSTIIDDNLRKLEEFYQFGAEREKSFIRNSINKMRKSGEKLAVLIAGGFHTLGITQMLKDNGCSYLVVAPVITERTDPSVYFSALRDGNSHIARTLKGEDK